jgi:AcrR family transcriptional regulator
MGKTDTKPSPAPPGRRTGLDQADVVSAALDLVVREGAAALTMRRLAAVLDVGTPTVYWHVGSRDDLVAEIVRTQSERLAERPVEGETARERVFSAAVHLYGGAIEHRPITSLAHQTGTASLLLHDLEAALVTELEAAGLTGEACAEALRSILVVVTGALVLALRDLSRVPEDYRADVLWARSGATVAPDTRVALCAEPDVDALTAATLRAVVEHHVPGEEAR